MKPVQDKEYGIPMFEADKVLFVHDSLGASDRIAMLQYQFFLPLFHILSHMFISEKDYFSYITESIIKESWYCLQ